MASLLAAARKRAAHDNVLSGALAPVCAGLAVVLSVTGATQAMQVEGTQRSWSIVVAVVTAVLLVGLALAARPRHGIAGDHPAVMAVAVVVTLGAGAHMIIGGAPRQTTYLVMVVVAIGAAMTLRGWYLATLASIWTLWGTAAITAQIVSLAQGLMPVASEVWLQQAIALMAATALSALLHVGRVRQLEQLAAAREAVSIASVRDDLTGLANRQGLEVMGRQLVEGARRRGDAVHCLFIDVDGFTRINDTAGRDAGDEVLVGVADALASCMRAGDVVARWADDEYVVVGAGVGAPALELERRIRAHLVEVPPVPSSVWSCRVSAGASVLEPWDDGGLDTMLRDADRDMYLRRSLRRPVAGVEVGGSTAER